MIRNQIIQIALIVGKAGYQFFKVYTSQYKLTR